jgi:hypothetical protein
MWTEQIIPSIISSFCFGSENEFRAKNGSLYLVDKCLYSYSLLIAKWDEEDIIVYHYTTKGGNFVRKATSSHVNKLLRQLEEQQFDYRLE